MKGYFIIDEEAEDFDIADLMNIPRSVQVGTKDIPLVTVPEPYWRELKSTVQEHKSWGQFLRDRRVRKVEKSDYDKINKFLADHSHAVEGGWEFLDPGTAMTVLAMTVIDIVEQIEKREKMRWLI